MPMKNQSHRREKAAGRARLRKNRSARYPIERSPLWKLSSIHRLAALLDVAVQDVEAVCMAPSYNRFDDQPKPGKEARHIQEPTESTLGIHYRIAKLLDSIERPDFLHSATKTRSHVTNAQAHLGSGGAVVAMDIRRFSKARPSTTSRRSFIKTLGARMTWHVFWRRFARRTATCRLAAASALCSRISRIGRCSPELKNIAWQATS